MILLVSIWLIKGRNGVTVTEYVIDQLKTSVRLQNNFECCEKRNYIKVRDFLTTLNQVTQADLPIQTNPGTTQKVALTFYKAYKAPVF